MKYKLLIIFVILQMTTAYCGQCNYCDTLDRTKVIKNENDIEKYKDNLDKCIKQREKIGIYRNYCEFKILEFVGDSNLIEKIEDLNEVIDEKCFEFYKKNRLPSGFM